MTKQAPVVKKNPPESYHGSWQQPDTHFNTAIDHPWFKAIFALTSDIVFTTYSYFHAKGLKPALTPVTALSITSPMGLGSDSRPVSVELFGQTTYLVDSMQFHLEYLMRQWDKGVFYVMPTFREEDADARHLNEFFHIEAEFTGKMDDNLAMIEGLLQAYVAEILKNHSEAVRSLAGGIDHLLQFRALEATGFKRIKFLDAVGVIGEHKDLYTWFGEEKIGLSNKGEQVLMQNLGTPLWVTHLPKLGVPFYQADADDGTSALCADLLMGIGEVVGSGQRHFSHSETLQAIKDRHVSADSYEWYLRMKEEYPLQTCGFGIGLERFLLWVLNHHDIRDIQLIVRQKGLRSVP